MKKKTTIHSTLRYATLLYSSGFGQSTFSFRTRPTVSFYFRLRYPDMLYIGRYDSDLDWICFFLSIRFVCNCSAFFSPPQLHCYGVCSDSHTRTCSRGSLGPYSQEARMMDRTLVRNRVYIGYMGWHCRPRLAWYIGTSDVR
jgi:hypothetical protein